MGDINDLVHAEIARHRSPAALAHEIIRLRSELDAKIEALAAERQAREQAERERDSAANAQGPLAEEIARLSGLLAALPPPASPARLEIDMEVSQLAQEHGVDDVEAAIFQQARQELRAKAPKGNLHIRLWVEQPSEPARWVFTEQPDPDPENTP